MDVSFKMELKKKNWKYENLKKKFKGENEVKEVRLDGWIDGWMNSMGADCREK